MSRAPRNNVPPWLSIWIPVGVFALPFILLLFGQYVYQNLLPGEVGLIENLTVVILVCAVVQGGMLLRGRPGLSKGLRWWIIVVLVACIYFLGEEVSWGQRALGWETPAWFARLNSQKETNLHNVSGFFDQVPRLVLQLFTIVAGIIVPLSRRRSGDHGKGIWPDTSCVLVAILAAVLQVPIWLEEYRAAAGKTTLHFGEVQECLFALFLWIYLASLARRSDR